MGYWYIHVLTHMCCFSTCMRAKHVLFSDNHVCLYMTFMCDKCDSYVLKLSIHVLTHMCETPDRHVLF